MTLEELKSSPKAFVTCQDIAPIVQADPHTLHMQAMSDIWRPQLGFPVTVVKTRVRIPRRAFLKYLGESEEDNAAVDG